jgi:hypothetical protein
MTDKAINVAIAAIEILVNLVLEKINLNEIKYKLMYNTIGSAIQYLPVITSTIVENDSPMWRTNNSWSNGTNLSEKTVNNPKNPIMMNRLAE